VSGAKGCDGNNGPDHDDDARSAGQGVAIVMDQHGSRRQRLHASPRGRFQRTLREATEGRLQFTPAASV